MARAGGWPARLAGLALLLCLAASEEDWSQCHLPCKCKWLSGRKAADCANGSLSVVPSGLSREIQWLDISNNRFTILPGEAFRSVGLINLHKVYLKECDIEELHKDALIGLEILIEIDLSGNKIKTLHPGVFSHNGRLRVIILNRNPIQKIVNRVFTNLTFLQTVEMNDCQIAHIAHEAFVKVGNLQTLRIAGNNLTNMKPDTLRRMERLKSLEMHNNPWNCDCHLKTFWEWIMAQNLYAQPTACQDPEPLRGRMWSELEPDSLACKPEVWLHPADGVKVHGGDATLSCRVQGNPEPTVHWVYKSRIIGNSSRHSRNDHPYVVRDGRGALPRWVNLTVADARHSDDGEYSCVARNPGGMAEAKVRLEVVDGGVRGGGGMLGGSIGDAWPLILGLVAGMVVLLVIVVVLVCCYCRTKDPRTNNNTKKAMGEGVSSNGDLSYHSGPGSEQEKSLITVVNPVQKPPRRYETLSTSAPNELEMKATLLDNGSVITGPSVADCDDPLRDRSLESLETAPARSRETIDGECLGLGLSGVGAGVGGGVGGPGRAGAMGLGLGAMSGAVSNLPPDLLSFPSRGSQVSPAGSSASTAPDSSRLPAQHGPQSPVRSPLFHPSPMPPPPPPQQHLFGTLPYSRSQSPFSPALTGTPVVMPRQGYVTIPRRPRVPSWSSPPAPVLALDPLTAKLEPVYDNLGPRTTADGSSVLSLNKAGAGESPVAASTPAGGGMRSRPLPPTPTFHPGLPPYYSPIAPIAEQPSPAVARAALPKQRSNPNLSSLSAPDAADSLGVTTPSGKRASVAASLGPASPMNGAPGRPGSAAGGAKVPPKPPPKPKKKPAAGADAGAAGPLYEDEGEDGTEV